MTRWQKALAVFFAAAVAFVTAVAATVQTEQITLDKLKAMEQRLNLKIDPNKISTSGISSGGFMAHQLHVAHSSNLMGVGIIAGGPYNCAQGSAVKGMQECTAMGEVIRWLPDLPYLSYQGPDPAPQGREASDKAMAMAKQAVSDTLSVDKNNKIDNPKGLFGDRVILIHGKSDRLLPEGVMDATNQYYKMIYEHYGQALPADTLTYLKTLPAEHSVPTDNFIGLKVAAGEKVMVEKGERVGNCKTFGSPYLNVCAKQDCAGSCCPESAKPACGDPADSANPACTPCDLQCSTQCVTSIDASGMILKHIYGGPSQEWKPRSNIKVKDWGQSGAPPTVEQGCKRGNKIDARCQWLRERIFAFDQPTVFADSRQSYLADKGFLFVPKQCAQGRTCKLHIAFHGCAQGYGFKDKDTVNALYSGIWPHFVENAGLNEWADANDIVVLYPQVLTTTLGGNPFGCWNFWGYGADIINYPTKDGRQISAVWKMVEALVPSLKQ